MDFIVFSHLRWDFVYQRPQHLLSRAARHNRVFFWEEPISEEISTPSLRMSQRAAGLWVCVPHLPLGLSESEAYTMQTELLGEFLEAYRLKQFVAWYYTPMALNFTRHLAPQVTVYDCMDQLSAFRGAPPGLRAAETELFRKADVVFTGGQSLYEAKREQHSNVHPFPSSIDVKHFKTARDKRHEPADQATIPAGRVGFAGVIDERLDIELLQCVSELLPNWQFVMIGPVVKITQQDLPVNRNIHYLGAKAYEELPAYMSGWDVGILPFAMNEATRFISPTKTPEYLAAGLPVVSAPIRDVVRPYAGLNLVSIAATPEEFARAIETEAARRVTDKQWRKQADDFLATNSWDLTWKKMHGLIEEAASARRSRERAANKSPVITTKTIATEQAF
jgi:UDP-galactopyranose mutase